MPPLPLGFYDVPRPPGLEIDHIQRAITFIESGLTEWIEVYFQQMNLFSALVSVFGAKALDSVSSYEKNPHRHKAAGAFPDLCRRGCSTSDPRNCLESKGSKRPWPIQAHYNHSGWYIVWRYLVDETETIQPGRPIIIWRVDSVFLEKTDWKYEGSKAGSEGGGRTHTFSVKDAAKRLRGCALYQRQGIVLRHSKPVPVSVP